MAFDRAKVECLVIIIGTKISLEMSLQSSEKCSDSIFGANIQFIRSEKHISCYKDDMIKPKLIPIDMLLWRNYSETSQ